MGRAVLTDDDLHAFIEGLPSEAELLEELHALSKLPGAEPERCCLTCNSSLALYRRNAIYCSAACKQHVWDKRNAALIAARRRARREPANCFDRNS